MLPEASTLAALICTLGKCARVLLGLEIAPMAGSAARTANRAIGSVKRCVACSIFVSSILRRLFHFGRAWMRRISLAGNRRGLFVEVKQDVRRRRLHAKLTQHADDLAAV